MNLVAFGVHKPVPVNLLMIALLVGGAVAAVSLRREFFPEVEPRRALIAMPYPGASPEEIEETLAIKVEDALAELDEVEEITTNIVEGGGTVIVEFRDGVTPREGRDEVERAMDALQDLPSEAEEIQVQLLEPRLPVIRVALYGQVDEAVLKRAIRGVRDDLRTLPGMGEIVTEGVRDYEISVEVDRDAMLRLGVSLPRIADRIGAWLRDVPGGTVRTSTGNIKVRTMGVPEQAEAIRDVIVASDPAGGVIRVGDIARVREGFVDEHVITRHNGEPAANLTIFAVGEQDVVRMAKKVRAYIAGRRGEPLDLSLIERLFGSSRIEAYILGRDSPHPLPAGAHIEPMSDLARFVEGRLGLLTEDGVAGTLLVFATLLVFLNWRAALWVSMGLLTAVGGALVLMWAMGITLNLLSMFGLILIIGLMVDDAIVIAENSQTLYDRGVPPLRAAIEGTRMVFWPVVATVGTTVLAFLPLMFVRGQIGDLIRVLPVVVVLALAVSLVESLLILPCHLGHGLAKHGRGAQTRFARAWKRYETRRDELLFGRAVPAYTRLLDACLRLRYASIIGAVVLVAVSLAMVASGRLVFTFLSDTDAETFIVSVEMPLGTPVERTARVAARIEQIAAAQPETKSISTQIGRSTNIETGRAAAAASHIAQMFVELIPVEQRDRPSSQVIDSIRRALAGEVPEAERIGFSEISGGPAGADISIRIRGRSPTELSAAAGDLKRALTRFEGVYDINDDQDLGQPELKVRLKPAAAPLGLTVEGVARQVRGFLYGIEAHTFAARQEDIDVRVRLADPARRSVVGLTHMWIVTPAGESVPLTQVADIHDSETYAAIHRIDRQRAVTVTAETASWLSPETIVARLVEPAPDQTLGALDQVRRRHPGLTIELTGRQEQMAEAFASLPIGFAVGILLIYCNLAWLFSSYLQPIIVLLAVPFSIVGVVWGHLAFGYDLTFLSLIGFVALSGVVANDSLIFVEFFNAQRKKGVAVHPALLAAGQARIRAIGLTTITSVVGLMPMVLEQSFQAKFLIPMGISISMGLLSSALLVLIVLPCIILVAADLRHLAYYLWHGETDSMHPMSRTVETP